MMPTTRNKDGSKSMARDKKICVTCGKIFLARRRYGNEDPSRFCSRHCYLTKTEKPWNYKPDGFVSKQGYRVINGEREHIAIAKKVLRRNLRQNEIVHHINGVKDDNRHENLIICTMGYHQQLHSRMAKLYQAEHFN